MVLKSEDIRKIEESFTDAMVELNVVRFELIKLVLRKDKEEWKNAKV